MQTSNSLFRAKATGFTLVELMVVVAIIGLLAAILFPVFSRARENARRTTCQSNLRQIGLAFIQYTQDFDERVPSRTSGSSDTDVTLQPYLKSKQVWRCPSQTKVSDAAGNDTNPVATSTSQSYGYNFELANGTGLPLPVIGEVARTCLISEHRGGHDRSWALRFNSGDKRADPDPRHFDGLNVVFLDGHVKWLQKGNRGLTCPTSGNHSGTFWKPTTLLP